MIWRKGIDPTKDIYRLTCDFPPEEKSGVASQIRRTAASVPSNIAEGQARKSTSEFKQFLSAALGSLAELETQLTIGTELGYGTTEGTEAAMQQVYELQKMIHCLQAKLGTSQKSHAPGQHLENTNGKQ